jgi:hypothetical protein
MHPAQQRQRLAFKRMPLQYDPHRRRKAIEVGSVALVRSTMLITNGYGSFSVTESTTVVCFVLSTNG